MACPNPSKFFPVEKTLALPKGSLNGKLALITGGGTGLGRAMADTFAQLGAKVVIAARRLDVLEKTAAELRAKTGGEVVAIQLDVKKPEAVAAAFDQIEAKFGRLPNIVCLKLICNRVQVVNNAAGNFIMATQRLSPNAIKTVVEIVLLGTLNVTTELGRRAIKNGTGAAVLNITTPYARSGAPFVVPSAVSKAGVENMVRSLACEWGKHGLRFNVIAPGPIPTEVSFLSCIRSFQGAYGRLSQLSVEDAAKASAETVPEGRVGAPEELANLAAFICSDYGFGNHLHDLDDKEWAEVEDTIRGRTGKDKSKI